MTLTRPIRILIALALTAVLLTAVVNGVASGHNRIIL